MNSFSQRQGIKPIAQVVQIGVMNDELRNSLWNVLDTFSGVPLVLFTAIMVGMVRLKNSVDFFGPAILRSQ